MRNSSNQDLPENHHKNSLLSNFSDIRSWIVLFFLLRLIGITNPPLETGHNWRQSLTAMIARNFLETDNNILYPRVDMAGDLSGIIGSEFPLFNYVIYLFSLLFGYSHWYGRLINLIVSGFGTFAFYKLIEKLTDKKIAFNSTLIFLASIWFAFSRKIMPDTFSVSLVLMGLQCCSSYLQTGSKLKLLLFFVFTTLGMLCKIPALSLLAPVILIFYSPKIEHQKKISVFAGSFLSLLLVWLWYFQWVPLLLNQYHYQLYFPKGILEGLREIIPLAKSFFQKFYFDALSSYSSIPFVLAGIFLIFKESNQNLKMGFGLLTLTFLVFTLKTGAVFPQHNYYIIPFVPVMAFTAGYAISKLPSQYLKVALFLLLTEAMLNQQHDFFLKESEKYKLQLEQICNQNIGKKDLIVINGGNSPQTIYFCNRKGWTIENEKVNHTNLMELKEKGAAYFILDKSRMNSSFKDFPLIYTDEHIGIYKLE